MLSQTLNWLCGHPDRVTLRAVAIHYAPLYCGEGLPLPAHWLGRTMWETEPDCNTGPFLPSVLVSMLEITLQRNRVSSTTEASS